MTGALTAVDARTAEPSPAEELLELAHHRAEVGRPDEALAMARAAVSIYRRLAAAHPAFTPDLTRALVELAVLTSELSWQLAVTPAREALGLYRRLVATDPAAAPDVVRPLSGLLTYLAEMSTCRDTR